MAGAQGSKQLSDQESADLNERVGSFQTAWKAAGSASIAAFLPPPRSRHRRHVLVELVKADMELRAKGGLPIRIDTYVEEFPSDLAKDELPTALIAEEYHLRNRFGDQPKLEDYRRRFPQQYAELAQHVEMTPSTKVSPRTSVSTSIGVNESVGQSTPAIGPVQPTRGSASKVPTGPTAPTLGGDILPAGLQYKLLRRLGRGAFGEVFEAEAPGGFRVAIKRILRDMDHAASQGEIDSLNAIKSMAHPYLLQTQAYWVYEDRLIIVMELADGSLADRIDFHKKNGLVGVPPEELVPFFEQTAEALDYLHSLNVTHRDIKPQNLLHLKGYAKVADFGLAREQDKSMQTIGMEVGTPMFMAPEVWSQKVSIHSDQYSLAATYIQARLGRPLFDTKIIAELCHKHVLETPNLDALPEAERVVLLKALAKKPLERYPSCVAFAKAMRAAVMPPEIVPDRRTSRRALVALIVGGLAVGGTAVALLLPSPPPPPLPPLPPPPSPPPPPLPPPAPWRPAGWVPENPDDIATLPNGKRLHPKLVRQVLDEKLVAILIAPAKSSDPPAFYLMENKVTNRAFGSIWEQAKANPHATLHRFLEAPPTGSEGFFPGDWKKGALNSDGEPLGVEGKQAGVPVVGVTAPEAIVVAEELGGVLPTYEQWLRAVDVPAPGPAGEAEKPNEDLTQRPLALGLIDGPWPVDKPTKDRGVNGVHQLTSNGFEWTRTRLDNDRTVDLGTLPSFQLDLKLVGQPWDLPSVLTTQRIPEKNRAEPWLKTEHFIGFRVAFEPQ